MEEFTESKIRYLEMVQNIIARMASNCFTLKGLAVALIAAILALLNDESDKRILLVTLFPILILWLLDSYYLQLERKYRALYENIRKSDYIGNIFELDLKRCKRQLGKSKKLWYIACLISKTEWFFYIPLALLVWGILYLFDMK